MNLIPAFDFHEVIIRPWAADFGVTVWVVLMGFFVAAGCGLVGNYLLLRRMALVGDAISHSILFGLVGAFLIFRTAGTLLMFLGAVVSGLLTVGVIEFIHRQSRVKPDAAICIAFTTLFALGVIMLSVAEIGGPVHIDAECVLYGEIAFVALEPPLRWAGIDWGPPSVIRMGAVLGGVLLAITVFYKELLLTSFDPGLARSMGWRGSVWHYGLMALLSIVIVSAFEAVGAILAIAMLIVPPMFAAQLSSSLPARLGLTVLHGFLSSVAGYHLSIWLQCSTAGAMVVTGALLFVVVWIGTGLASLRPSMSSRATENLAPQGPIVR
ncbi:MAG: manganese ABC transporter permease MntD [Terrimicrobiaceae bacterium]